MAGNDPRIPEHVDRDRGLARSHREVVADRQHRVVGLPEVADQLHVAEDAGVAGEVDRAAVLEPDHEPAGLAAVGAVRRARGVEGVHERVRDAVELVGPALVEPRQLADVRALRAKPALQLHLRDHLGSGEALRKLDCVADVVAVAVRDADDVDPFGVLLVVGRLRVAREERVDVDPLAAIAAEHERRMPEPRQGSQVALLSSRGAGVGV